MTQYSILSTKKLIPSLTQNLVKQGIAFHQEELILIEPVLSGETLETVLPLTYEPGTAVIFTSRNAVEIVAAVLHANEDLDAAPTHWQIFSLAGTTRDAILELFDNEPTGDVFTGALLAETILAADDIHRVVFFCSNQRRDELPNILSEHDIEVNEVITYETIETPVTLKENIDGVLFFSPSAVSSFFSANKLPASTVCFAIGNTTAKAISDYTNNTVIICKTPTQQCMLDLVKEYFIKK
ncbi:uroporphyrinogen-III synthase [Pseudoflavitalea rhizosphaerae]|uniref:uroporphyrinogen-III synthase n=1 Tax=Pseudoflavitalea rhizosphaerae TaxID=1884793 RepID=UPI001F499764|nr:uroporphyrinogen-III synthase [Pseudoflavitalea rhizosphaerae]